MTALTVSDLQSAPPSLTIREEEFCEWVGRAEPGQQVDYHRGILGMDRAKGFSPFDEKRRRELGRIANRAMALAQKGRLLLVQRRHGEVGISYIAIIATRRRAP